MYYIIIISISLRYFIRLYFYYLYLLNRFILYWWLSTLVLNGLYYFLSTVFNILFNGSFFECKFIFLNRRSFIRRLDCRFRITSLFNRFSLSNNLLILWLWIGFLILLNFIRRLIFISLYYRTLFPYIFSCSWLSFIMFQSFYLFAIYI